MPMPAFVVDPRGGAEVFRTIDDAADGADADGRAVSIGENQAVVGLRGEDLVVGINRQALPGSVETALGRIHGGGGDHAADIHDPIQEGARLRNISPDPTVLPTADRGDSVSGDTESNADVVARGRGGIKAACRFQRA